MSRLMMVATLAALCSAAGCKKVGEGEYETRKPVVGVTRDTVSTPSVETGSTKDTVTVPKVSTEKKEVEVPKVKVKSPNDRNQ